VRELLYADKANRDKMAAELNADGYHVKRSSIRNQQLHPMYIEDRPSGNTGFGNTDYQQTWSVLYSVSW
jgi:hypothetical protein